MFHARVLACTAEQKRMTKQTQQQQSPDPKANRVLQILDSEDYDALMAGAKVGCAEVPQTPLSPG